MLSMEAYRVIYSLVILNSILYIHFFSVLYNPILLTDTFSTIRKFLISLYRKLLHHCLYRKIKKS